MAGRIPAEIIPNADGSLGFYANGVEKFRFDPATASFIVLSGAKFDVNSGGEFEADAGATVDIASGLVQRADLVEDALQVYGIPLSAVLGADGADLAITETAGDFYRNIGTNQLLILGEVSNGTVGADTEVSVGWFEFQLPPEYVAGGDISVRAGVDVVGAGALGTCTIDFSAYLQNALTGAVGSDLVTTAAQAISKTEGYKTFVVDPTGLVPGDKLIFKMTTSVDNTDSTAIQAQIAALDMLLDIKG